MEFVEDEEKYPFKAEKKKNLINLTNFKEKLCTRCVTAMPFNARSWMSRTKWGPSRSKRPKVPKCKRCKQAWEVGAGALRRKGGKKWNRRACSLNESKHDESKYDESNDVKFSNDAIRHDQYEPLTSTTNAVNAINVSSLLVITTIYVKIVRALNRVPRYISSLF